MVAKAVVIAVASFVLTVLSTAYVVATQRIAQRRALREADLRKGLEIPTENSNGRVPFAYGRSKIGGIRVFHQLASRFEFTSSGAQKTFATTSSGAEGYRYLFRVFAESFFDTLVREETAAAIETGDFSATNNQGSANEFLFFQQSMCMAPIQGVYDIVVDDARYIDDPSLGEFGETVINDKKVNAVKAALRVNVFYNGSQADSMMAANFSERSSAIFTDQAYLSCYARLNRDEPQFTNIPVIQPLIEGRKVRTVNAGILSSTRTYTNSSPLVLLDYMLDPDGADIDVALIDLPSFEYAHSINTPVMLGAAVAGKIWQPTDGGRSVATRDVLRFETNGILSTEERTARENIGVLLTPMANAELIWSGGKFKLTTQYPATDNDIIVALEVTDSNLVADKQITIEGVPLNERYNHVSVKYLNEFNNFREDVAAWPPKISGTFREGIGGNRYSPPTNTGFDTSRLSGRLLAEVGVWVGSGSSASFSWTFIVRPDEAGLCTLQWAADDRATVVITDVDTGGIVYSGSGSNWKTLFTANFNLGGLTDKSYRVDVNASDNGKGEKGFGAKISNGIFELWNSRSPSFTSFREVTLDSTLYETFKSEDNELNLETEIFAELISDPYHALAKAEEIVRTSRSSTRFEFSVYVENIYLEPGDVIKLDSSVIPFADFVYVIVKEVSTDENGIATIRGVRFLSSQLAWNVEDDIYVTPPPILEFKIPIIREVEYIPTAVYVDNLYLVEDDYFVGSSGNSIFESSGTITWSAVNYESFAGYILYIHIPGVDAVDAANRPIYRELTRTTSTVYVLPKIVAASAFFGVASYTSSGKISEMTVISKTQATDLENNWLSGTTVSWGAIIDDGSKPQNNADVTENSIIRITDIVDQVYFANSTGAVIQPFSNLTVVVTRGTTVITRDANVSYEIRPSSGLFATISNVTSTKGVITITDFVGLEATLQILVNVSGVIYTARTVRFTKQIQADEQVSPPVDGVIGNSTAWPIKSFTGTLSEHVKFAGRAVGANQFATFRGFGSYYFETGLIGYREAQMQFRVGYRLVGDSGPITFGSSQPENGTQASGGYLERFIPQEPLIYYEGTPGGFFFTISTPPLAAGNYEFFVYSRMLRYTSNPFDMFFEGNLTLMIEGP